MIESVLINKAQDVALELHNAIDIEYIIVIHETHETVKKTFLAPK